MITAVLITHNQCTLLKQNLLALIQTLEKINGTCLIIDDASNDSTKEYIQTHYPDITYQRNPFEEGLIKSLNNALDHIHTPYFLLIDPHIHSLHLNFSELLTHINNKHPYAITLQTQRPPLQLHYTYPNIHMSTAPKKTQALSEALLINTEQCISLGGFKTCYKTPQFSLSDNFFKAQTLGLLIDTSNTQSLKSPPQKDIFFSTPYTQKHCLVDNWIFQWTHCRSFYFKWRRFTHIVSICLTVKPKQLYPYIQALCLARWRLPKLPYKWYIYSDTDLLIQKEIHHEPSL